MLGKHRKSELEDIRQNAAGEYIYTGAWYNYSGTLPRARALALLWLSMGLSGALLLAAGFLPAPGALNCFYVVLPYVAALVSAVSAIWSLGQLTAAGDPIKAFPYETAILRLPRRALITAVLTAAALLLEILYLLLHGGTPWPVTALWLGLMALASACAVLARLLTRKTGWTRR